MYSSCLRIRDGLVNSTVSDFEYCREIVRQNDKDRFLCSLMVKDQEREALWSLFAFNYEIAKTREIVSEPTIGYIRLQWWRDALDTIYSKREITEHQIVGALARIIDQYDIPRDDFDLLISAREFDLEKKILPSLGAMFHYARQTNVPLLRLCAWTMQDKPAQEAMDYVGVKYGVTGLVRSMAHSLSAGHCFMPADLMKKHELQQSTMLSEDQLYARRDLILEIFSSLEQNIPHDFKCSKLPRFFKYNHDLAEHYKKRIKLFRYNMLQGNFNIPSSFFLLRSLLFK